MLIYSQLAGISPLLLYRIPLTYCCSHHSRKTANKNTTVWVILSIVFLDEIADSICLTLSMYSRRQPIVLLTILLLLWLNWPFVFFVLRFRNLLVLYSGFQFLGNLVAHGYDPPFLHTIFFKEHDEDLQNEKKNVNQNLVRKNLLTLDKPFMIDCNLFWIWCMEKFWKYYIAFETDWEKSPASFVKTL